MTNKELDLCVIAYKNGNKAIFNTIYKETYNSVYYTIYLITRNNVDTLDYVQDTYLQAIRKLDSYTIGTNFRAWLSTIAHNITINGVKKSNNEISIELTPETEGMFLEEVPKDDLIGQALEYLKDEEKEVFIYLYVDELTIKEIASKMNKNINQVYYIKNKLEDNLRKYFKL